MRARLLSALLAPLAVGLAPVQPGRRREREEEAPTRTAAAPRGAQPSAPGRRDEAFPASTFATYRKMGAAKRAGVLAVDGAGDVLVGNVRQQLTDASREQLERAGEKRRRKAARRG